VEDWILLALAMLATGCVAGVLAGLFGIGGGIVIVPVLEVVLGFVGVDPAIRMHVAVATSLATIIPTSISSARAHHRRGAVDVEIVKRWAIFVLVGALLGAWIASQVHSRVLAVVFATLALLVAAKMVLLPESRNLTNGVPRAPWVVAIPTAIGCFSSMMGIGGGTFSVMTLTLFNVPIHRAVGTAALFAAYALGGGLRAERRLPGALALTGIVVGTATFSLFLIAFPAGGMFALSLAAATYLIVRVTGGGGASDSRDPSTNGAGPAAGSSNGNRALPGNGA